jgi:hypothetical protein
MPNVFQHPAPGIVIRQTSEQRPDLANNHQLIISLRPVPLDDPANFLNLLGVQTDSYLKGFDYGPPTG